MRSLAWSFQSPGLITCIAEATKWCPKPTPEPLRNMAHLSRWHSTLNHTLSVKDNLCQVSYFSGHHAVKKKVCLLNLHLSGLTLHPQPWPSLINPLQEATDQAWTVKGCSPPRYSPTSDYPQHSRNVASPGRAGVPPVFWLKAPSPCSSKWKLELAVPSPRRLDLTKPQTIS